MGELLAILSALLFGLSSVFVRRAGISGERGMVVSTMVNALLNVSGLGLRVLGGGVALQPRALVYFILAGVFTTFLGRWFWFSSIRRIGPSRAGTWKNAQPLVVVAIAAFILGEPVTLVPLLGAGLVLGGLWVLGGEERQKTGVHAITAGAARMGILFGLASAVSFGVGNVLRKTGMQVWPEALAGMAIGASVAALSMLLTPQGRREVSGLAFWRWGRGERTFAFVGLLTSLSQFCLFSALAIAPVWIVNVIQSTEPLLVILMSLFLLKGQELVSRRVWLSAACVTLGIALIALRGVI